MNLQGARVLVVGLGRSGLAAVRLLAARGARVIANDLRREGELGETAGTARQLGAELRLGAHDEALFTSVDRIVLSPGVPPLPALAAAERAGIPIWSEIELSSRFLRGTIVGITGTNGKSTVTTLLGEMCSGGDRPVFVGGNLGSPLTDAVDSPAAGPDGVVVVELSSFQLERVEQLHLRSAALLNLSSDHLDRYSSFEQYAAAKARIFERQGPGDAAVVPDGDEACARLARSGRARLCTFGGRLGRIRVAEGRLFDAEGALSLPVDELGIRGTFNQSNACAAALLAILNGVSEGRIAEVLRSFRGLPHRLQLVRELGGVSYWNDSKATNVAAAAAALDALSASAERLVLIAGGVHKGSSYQPLRQRLRERGRAAVLIGEAAPLLQADLEGAGLPVQRALDLGEAVRRARGLARGGDAVLLAPACSSFDMFSSYAHRGQVFEQAVNELEEDDPVAGTPAGGRAGGGR